MRQAVDAPARRIAAVVVAEEVAAMEGHRHQIRRDARILRRRGIVAMATVETERNTAVLQSMAANGSMHRLMHRLNLRAWRIRCMT